ncbi:MAG: hypothetical protein U9O86_01980 [Campylobacterota bacterium]|nr:hypothetical protein [Campylobacterota bacterium]
MTTTKILTLTLLATTLTLGAAVPRELNATTKQRTNSISNQVASTLYRRGIDENVAKELSESILNNTDEELFALLTKNYANDSGIKLEEIYTELGKLALQRKNVDFSSYSFLLKLTQSIKKESLSKDELEVLEAVSTKNTLIYNTFS